ncbi:hypothetical protein V7S43_014495 [Phytophthora oleae]|uniref:Uncharacterized protein n=1 Tax=Phytophthora oleae TaxID=2107226 RepID=A0ABD3F3V6_9STRA
MALLYQELESPNYSEEQHKIIQEAYAELQVSQSTAGLKALPEWFVGWYELEDEVVRFRRGIEG